MTASVTLHAGQPAMPATRRERLEAELARLDVEEIQIRLVIRDLGHEIERAEWRGLREEIRELQARRLELRLSLLELRARRERLGRELADLERRERAA